jgi:hypothetical protein
MVKIRFEAELDPKLAEEIGFWGFDTQELVKDAMEHGIWGSIRRKTDNLCRGCRKPIEASIPLKDRTSGSYPQGFCRCR